MLKVIKMVLLRWKNQKDKPKCSLKDCGQKECMKVAVTFCAFCCRQCLINVMNVLAHKEWYEASELQNCCILRTFTSFIKILKNFIDKDKRYLYKIICYEKKL